jgi:periplasmic copper chaperone A
LRQFFFPFLVVALLLAGCSKKSIEDVREVVVTLPAVPGNPGAAYFTLQGGETDNRLMDVSSPQVVKIELHDNVMANGMMKMTPMDAGVAVPAGGKVVFKSGGKHAMLFDINPKISPGTKMKLVFTYASGRKIEVDADVTAAGDAGGHQH